MARATCGIYEALWLAKLHQASVGALYLHLPFCARKCAYCDFSSWATKADDPLIPAYVTSLQRMLEEADAAGLLQGCQTAYVGGGTPTIAGAWLSKLVASVMSLAPTINELTCEANPDSLTDMLLAELPAAGCTRLSVGVQSLCDAQLKELGRIHTVAQALDRLKAAVATGLFVSCDLMCAIPLQTQESWLATLEGVIAAGVGHVSVYPLQIEEGTPFDLRYASSSCPWNDTEVQAERMEEACKVLESASLARYEVASYAKPGQECRHNQAYWTAVPYLGLGTGASSMLTREGYARLRRLAPQLPAAGEDVSRVRLTCSDLPNHIAEAQSVSDLHFDLEMLSEPQAAAEDLMLAMRMVRGAGPGLLAHARKVLGKEQVDTALISCEQRGLVRQQGASWVPTSRGWLLGNELYGCMWDLASSVD
ncbi:MAG: coproporphyrinogen-III oxidase family protein [Atopobiaceae bacterium]|nr:coproporphyrinogen-III oxidase family protein [Atopobiaceae bacterium]